MTDTVAAAVRFGPIMILNTMDKNTLSSADPLKLLKHSL